MTRVNPKRIVVPDEFHPLDLEPLSRSYKRQRPVASDHNPKFKELVEAVRKDGVLNPVRVKTDSNRIVLAEAGHYYRLMAAKEAGLKTVPTVGLDDEGLLESA